MQETAVESRALASLMYTLSAGVSDMVKGTSNLIKINDRFDVSWPMRSTVQSGWAVPRERPRLQPAQAFPTFSGIHLR